MGNTKSTEANKKTENTKNEFKEQIKAIPVSRSKGSSNWFNSYSSRRASVNGPYYRARGLSINQTPENNDPFSASISPPMTDTMSEAIPTLMTWTQGGKEVYVTGTFNDWKHKVKMVKSIHDFNILLNLSPGTHRFKFIVDNEWSCSNDMETTTNPDGSLVNYIQVMNEEDDNWDTESIKSETYSNTIPPELLMGSSKDDFLTKEPPTLPPHLHMLLNSTSQEDNSVLYEPNHVTLNHLYTSSMKDDVLALGTTARYCKKVKINSSMCLN